MDQRENAICGFVPAYVLEAIAESKDVHEEAQKACKATIKHSLACTHRRDATVAPSLAEVHKLQASLAAPDASGGLQRRIYDCKGRDDLPGALVRSEGDARTKDRQVSNCYDGFKITYDFFSKVFGRDSLDGKGMTLIGSVHYNDEPDETPGYNNAYWDGKQMVFGDGDHIYFDYLTDSLDVIAHELSHGFVQFSSPLRYSGQSGALNESCADIFGSMTEQWHMRQSAEDADWNVGQTLFPVAFTGSALRTLKAGKAYADDPVLKTDRQPKHMRDLYTGSQDGGGVHINSGIPNHAFYLASKALGGNSWDKAGQVWYKTMTSDLIPYTCNFETFAKATVKIAEENYDETTKKAIYDAWVAVGVLTAAE